MSSPNNRKKVLFLCIHNSARSQMAEGILIFFYGKYYHVQSAGTHPQNIHPYAIEVMKEIGIDISSHKSKSVNLFSAEKFDYVVTLCDQAREQCPYFPRGKNFIHKSFQDPSLTQGNHEVVIESFRRIRDEIKSWIQTTFNPHNLQESSLNSHE
ncbi:arsenate reductase ArsC [bacterium]|nr:arsenate reductase ArsC [bacterium]